MLQQSEQRGFGGLSSHFVLSVAYSVQACDRAAKASGGTGLAHTEEKADWASASLCSALKMMLDVSTLRIV